MDFAKSIFENTGRMPLVCAHRGSSAGNIPCNTLAAFNAAKRNRPDVNLNRSARSAQPQVA